MSAYIAVLKVILTPSVFLLLDICHEVPHRAVRIKPLEYPVTLVTSLIRSLFSLLSLQSQIMDSYRSIIALHAQC